METKDLWDLRIKALAAVGGVVTVAIAVGNYVYTHDRDAQAALRESRKPFLAQQLSLYVDATRAAAQLATLDPKSNDWGNARLRFWQLYWGELIVVEDVDVAKKMQAFGDQLKTVDPEKGVPTFLDAASRELAEACRRSIERNWDYELPPLP